MNGCSTQREIKIIDNITKSIELKVEKKGKLIMKRCGKDDVHIQKKKKKENTKQEWK